MTSEQITKHLENLLLSHAIMDALNAKTAVVLSRSNGYWSATVSGGRRLETIALPYAASMPYGIVAAEVANSLLGAEIVVRLD